MDEQDPTLLMERLDIAPNERPVVVFDVALAGVHKHLLLDQGAPGQLWDHYEERGGTHVLHIPVNDLMESHEQDRLTGSYCALPARTGSMSSLCASQYRMPCMWPVHPPPELFLSASTTRWTCWKVRAASKASDCGDGRVRLLGMSPIWPEMNTRSSTCDRAT